MWTMKLSSALWLLSVVALSWAYDGTRTRGAWGGAVVGASVRALEDSCVFPNDHQLLRRFAWAASRFGARLQPFATPLELKNGGIWETDEYSLDFAKHHLSNAQLLALSARLGVEVEALDRDLGDLWYPLNSAVAARAFLYANVSQSIPLDLAGQAALWRQAYGWSSVSAQDFVSAVQEMPDLCSSAGADILFLVDSSGSIGSYAFDNVRSFLQEVVRNLRIGQRNFKIAVDDFSSGDTSVIGFGDYADGAQLLRLIAQKIPYYNSGTCMVKAFQHAASFSLTAQNGVRPAFSGFPRLAVLLTDGQPNCYSSSLRTAQAAVAQAAQALKDQGVRVLTVGVGSGVDSAFLYNLASEPKCMSAYTLTNYKALGADFAAELRSRACQAVAVLPLNGTHEVSNTLAQNQSLHLQISASTEDGVTIRVGANEGSVTTYVSKTARNPSAAAFDWELHSDGSQTAEVFVAGSELTSGLPCVATKDCPAALPLFTSVEGMAAVNNFSLGFAEGNDLGGTTARPSCGFTTAAPASFRCDWRDPKTSFARGSCSCAYDLCFGFGGGRPIKWLCGYHEVFLPSADPRQNGRCVPYQQDPCCTPSDIRALDSQECMGF